MAEVPVQLTVRELYVALFEEFAGSGLGSRPIYVRVLTPNPDNPDAPIDKMYTINHVMAEPEGLIILLNDGE